MDNSLEYRSVKDLLELFRNKMLTVNPEYQRGEVWSEPQKKKLIDSVLRGYPLPVIYLHHIQREVSGMRRDDLEIIDGQQRINAIHAFREGAFQLFDPIMDESQARFPVFLKEQPCPWGRKAFESLSNELQAQFLETKLPIAVITSESTNEVRDLFVRLQSGLPLNPQEKRDAHPGDFNHFVLKLGGKSQLPQYPGHPFFRHVSVPNQARGGARTVAAQVAMLFLIRRENGPENLTNITSGAIDEYYYRHIDFDYSSSECQRLFAILDKIESLLGDGKRPKLRAHIAIHLVLFVDDLWDDYTRSWESMLAGAVDKFIADLATATKKSTDSPEAPNEFWIRYGQWARTDASEGSTIGLRHRFYAKRMHESLGPLQMKDTTRNFGRIEKEIIYFLDAKKCQECHSEVVWTEAEIHHVKEHHEGGKTQLDNGALVHRVCHPKTDDAVKAFADSWQGHPGSL